VRKRSHTAIAEDRRKTMKARLSLVSAIAVTALAVSVPAAPADPGLDGAPKLADPVAYFHANELASAATSGATSAPYADAFERPSPTSVAAPTSTVEDTGSSLAWGQISLAFVIGLLLAVGLMAAVRFRTSRPVAQ
jgi:hypothetical protein